uniref:Secreted protein n=1 Tax=Ixodes ricinus TaxID=34613 RepID=A0A147BDB7_IXORI
MVANTNLMRFTLYIIIFFVRRAAYQKPTDTEPVHFSVLKSSQTYIVLGEGNPITSKLFLWINLRNILRVPRRLTNGAFLPEVFHVAAFIFVIYGLA